MLAQWKIKENELHIFSELHINHFTNLINQELKLDYCSSTVMLTVAFNSWPAKAGIGTIKE